MIIDVTADGDRVFLKELKISEADEDRHHVTLLFETELVDGSGRRSDITNDKVILNEFGDQPLRVLMQRLRDKHKTETGR